MTIGGSDPVEKPKCEQNYREGETEQKVKKKSQRVITEKVTVVIYFRDTRGKCC